MPAWIHSDPNADDGYWRGHGEQRPCARGERCASRDRNGQPALGPRVLCSADRDIVLRCLQQLPQLYVELWMNLNTIGTTHTNSPMVGGTHAHTSPPLLIRGDVDALMTRIVEVLGGWEARVVHVAHLDTTGVDGPRRHGVAVSTMCRTLTTQIDVLLALEPEPMNRSIDAGRVSALPEDADGTIRPEGWAILRQDLSGADAALDILSLHSACRAKLGYRPQHHDLLSPCWNPDCEQRMLRRWDGSVGMEDHVECRACGERYEGERLARLMVDEDRAQQRRTRKEAS